MRHLLRIGGLAPPLDAEALRERARRKTGLSDFGDPGHAEAIDQLLASIHDDIELDGVGRVLVGRLLVGALANRLWFVDAKKRLPEALTAPVRRPILIAALPRTGSTLLQQLLAAHPDALSLPSWAAIRPFPRPKSLTRADLGRRVEATATSWAIRTFALDQMQKHPYLPDAAAECSYLQLSSFASIQWWGVLPAYAYVRWLMEEDGQAAYAELADQFRLLQHGEPGTHWALKSPSHFIRLDTTLAAFPDARVVMLHRDPVKVMASSFSLLSSGHRIVWPGHDRKRLADVLLDALGAAADRAVERPHQGRFLDVQYADLVADPVRTVRRIHEWAGERTGDDVDAAVARRLAENPPHRFGRHTYATEDAGWDPDALRERFARYVDHFEVRT